jgi:hypothetical protein
VVESTQCRIFGRGLGVLSNQSTLFFGAFQYFVFSILLSLASLLPLPALCLREDLWSFAGSQSYGLSNGRELDFLSLFRRLSILKRATMSWRKDRDCQFSDAFDVFPGSPSRLAQSTSAPFVDAPRGPHINKFPNRDACWNQTISSKSRRNASPRNK